MKKKAMLWLAVVLLFAVVCVSCGKAKGDGTLENSDPPSADVGEQEKPGEDTPNGSEQGSLPIAPGSEELEEEAPIPLWDPEYVEMISTQGQGQGNILRVTEAGELTFSPEISQLRELVEIGESLEDYTAEIIFVLLDEEGNECYAYPQIELPISQSQGEWFELYLQTADLDCGFCPTVGKRYTLDLTVVKEERAVLAGTWQGLTVGKEFESSDHYDPTPLPTKEELEKLTFTVYYLVSGVGGSIEGNRRQTLKIGQATEKVTAVAAWGYAFDGWSDGVSEATREGESYVRGRAVYAKFVKRDLDVGVADMYIQTDTGDPILSKVNYVGATVQIAGAAEDKYNVTLTGELRGRGNSSFSASAGQNEYKSKNSYRLKLTEKTNLLGVGKAENRDWVLQANKYDASNLRNYFVWNLANQMGSFPFVPNCTWVNLYINGDYRGIYMITDHVEAADDRVEVDDSLDAPDKGYLVELDFRGADELDVVEGLDYFYLPGFYDPASGISNPREWVIKSDVTSTEQTDFIKAYLISCHEAIMGGDRAAIEALVDIPSLVDMFILEELSKDVDAGGSSMFMQKDTGGKLYFTAPWDFDFGFGTYGPAVYTDGFVCESGLYDANVWFASLIDREWFLQAVYDRLLELADMIELAKVGVYANGEMLWDAADRNDERWGIYGQQYHSYVSSQASRALQNYREHIDFLCDWIDARYAWMVDEIAYRLSE